jgi:hypothetical protein
MRPKRPPCISVGDRSESNLRIRLRRPALLGLERCASAGREPVGRGRHGLRRLPASGRLAVPCQGGGGSNPEPSHRPAVPPRGLEPRSPRYEGGVLPVKLRWLAVRREPIVRTVGVEPTTPGWKSGMFPLHHVHERNPQGSHGTTVQLSRSNAAHHVSGHAAARWEGFEPSSPGLEPGILAGWTTTAHGCASRASPASSYWSRNDSQLRRGGRARYAHVDDGCSMQPCMCSF